MTSTNNNNNENLQQQITETKSITMSLENLQQQYSNLLVSYNQAVSDYINFLNQQSKMPCGSYNSDSVGIDQTCYNYIWQQAGCGAGTIQPAPNANTSWAQGQTLDGLINDSFLWATETDYNHRMGCYGNPGNPYIIIGVGTNGLLYSRQGLDAPWVQINDNSSGVIAICTTNNGQGLIGVGGDNQLYQKSSYTSNWTGPIPASCCQIGVSQGQDGTLVCVGTDHTLWSNNTSDINSGHYQTASPGEWIASSGVAIAPDSSIFVIGSNNAVFKKNSYQNLTNQQWQYMGNQTAAVKAITIAPDGTFIGVGTDNQLYTMTSYTNLTTGWQGPYNSENGSCCVVSITTVTNPNYNASNYSQLTQPNFNINNEPYVSIQGQAFNGTGVAGESQATTLQECQAACSNLENCTGATFVSNQCLLRTGDSPIVPSTENSYAIVPKSKQLLLAIENTNQQLISINQQITNQISNSQPLYNSQEIERSQQQETLISNYKTLVEEKKY